MRFQSLDGIRGILLLLMMWAHVDGLLTVALGKLSHHRLGFADAAYGFVALSGIVLGMVLTRLVRDKGERFGLRFVGKRLRVIYTYIALVSVLGWLMWTYLPVVNENWPREGTTGLSGLLGLLLLTGEPMPYWDILPMYLFLVCLSPLAILMFVRGRTSLVLALSMAAWLAAQIGLPQYPADLANALFGFPYNRFANPFVIWAWQFVFALALYIGFRVSSDPNFIPWLKDWVEKHVLALTSLFLVLFVIKFYSDFVELAPGVRTGEAESLFSYESKWRATPLYLLSLAVNGLLIFYLCTVAPVADHPRLRRLGRGVQALVSAPPLVAMGRRSIQVFAAHLILLLSVSLFLPVDHVSALGGSVLLLGLTASLLLVPPAISGLARLAGREARQTA